MGAALSSPAGRASHGHLVASCPSCAKCLLDLCEVSRPCSFNIFSALLMALFFGSAMAVWIVDIIITLEDSSSEFVEEDIATLAVCALPFIIHCFVVGVTRCVVWCNVKR